MVGGSGTEVQCIATERQYGGRLGCTICAYNLDLAYVPVYIP